MLRELFVYYRIDVQHGAAAHALVVAAQARLRERHVGLQTRLLRRPETEHPLQTWMEIYSFAVIAPGAHMDDNIAADIEGELAVLAPLLASPRHVEVFIPCA